jgi:hypothetical protein
MKYFLIKLRISIYLGELATNFIFCSKENKPKLIRLILKRNKKKMNLLVTGLW